MKKLAKKVVINIPINPKVGYYVIVTDCLYDSSKEYETFNEGVKGSCFQQHYRENYSDALELFLEKMQNETEMYKVNVYREKCAFQIIRVSQFKDEPLGFVCQQNVTISNF